MLLTHVALKGLVMLQKCSFLEHYSVFSWLRIYLIFLLFSGKQCTVPEASQEGLLHSFKSYSDVATFHYTVPKEVVRATWQFAAFMDGQNCPQRTVHIFLQWGSYPVISIDNASFPINMYPERDYTIRVSADTSFEPKTTAVIPIYGPEPGDWFVGAYLSHWDEKVQQQGLGHKCHYSIGSVGIWMQTNSIETIPVGYQKTLRTKETTSYYKIYISSGTWSFKVHIWGCNLTVHTSHSIHEPCIKAVAMKGRSLPVINSIHPHSVGNLTMLDTYTFTESSPYEDSYYYLLVISESVIEFNIEVRTQECPIWITEKPFVNQYVTVPLTPKTLAQFHIKNSNGNFSHYIIGSNITSAYKMQDAYEDQFQFIENNYDNEYTCTPRYQLARVKHSQSFSGVYLLQGRDWLTSWVMLTDLYPVVTQFDILPLVDTGGTLDISAHLEMDKSLTEQIVLVNICIRRGRVPEKSKDQLMCYNENMSLNLSSKAKNDASLLIPYPQPDTWYIALQAKCYVNSAPVNCEMEEILVSLDVRTRQCVFSGNYPCGHHGVCQEIHRDMLYYTACNCFEGYKGWGCTDATSANPKASLVFKTMLLTLSNAFFIPAIYIAVKRGLYTEGLVYSATMLFSSLYHACDQCVLTYCVAKYEVLQYSDFFSSILAFWVTLIAMAKLPTRFVSLFHMFGVLLIAFGVESDRTSLMSILLPLVIGIIIPIGTYTYRSFVAKKWEKIDDALKLSVGLVLAILGLLLFSLVETEANYQYVHSAWHILIAISLVFLLPSAQIERMNLSGSNSFSDDSELLDYKDSLDSPVFTVITGHESMLVLPS